MSLKTAVVWLTLFVSRSVPTFLVKVPAVQSRTSSGSATSYLSSCGGRSHDDRLYCYLRHTCCGSTSRRRPAVRTNMSVPLPSSALLPPQSHRPSAGYEYPRTVSTVEVMYFILGAGCLHCTKVFTKGLQASTVLLKIRCLTSTVLRLGNILCFLVGEAALNDVTWPVGFLKALARTAVRGKFGR